MKRRAFTCREHGNKRRDFSRALTSAAFPLDQSFCQRLSHVGAECGRTGFVPADGTRMGKQPDSHELTATKLPQSRRKNLKSPTSVAYGRWVGNCWKGENSFQSAERWGGGRGLQGGGHCLNPEQPASSVPSALHKEGSVVVGEWFHLRSATRPAFTAGSAKNGLPLAEETVL